MGSGLKVLIQRSLGSSVSVEDQTINSIEKGLVLLVCFEKGDTEVPMKKAIDKIKGLRVFPHPETGRMDLNINDFGGEVLAVSQFTLSWDGSKGNRPSFDQSMPSEDAQILFDKFVESLNKYAPVKTGAFGKNMVVQISNWGPVSFFLEF